MSRQREGDETCGRVLVNVDVSPKLCAHYRCIMTYRDFLSHVVDVVEAMGATIWWWSTGAFVRCGNEVVRHRRQQSFSDLRKDLGRVILLGLEVLIIADIIGTIVVDQSVESVAVLGIIVVIRVVLSFSLEVEIDGMWPWNRWRGPAPPASGGSPESQHAGQSPSRASSRPDWIAPANACSRVRSGLRSVRRSR